MQSWEIIFPDSIKPDQTFFFARLAVTRIDDLEQEIALSSKKLFFFKVVSNFKSRGTEMAKVWWPWGFLQKS